jgi:hypothetical protein
MTDIPRNRIGYHLVCYKYPVYYVTIADQFLGLSKNCLGLARHLITYNLMN